MHLAAVRPCQSEKVNRVERITTHDKQALFLNNNKINNNKKVVKNLASLPAVNGSITNDNINITENPIQYPTC